MNRYAEAQGLVESNGTLRKGRVAYSNVVQYPLIPLSGNDIYAITEFGDRLDNLAYQFYGDVSLWWIITIANPNKIPTDSLFIPIGTQIRIPQNVTSIIDNYNTLNRN
jgi:hypothetical protein|tara:strand:- start:909 stop:1232 length:324 start_codon:yes stop_codon:yes gene_type:complete